jgi:hypothetical protein
MNWDDVRQDFDWDGSLRDIYVLDVGLSGWRGLWRLLKQATAWRITYQVDGNSVGLPDDVEVPLRLRPNAAALVSVFLGNVRFNSHFFDDGDIEFDLDPREVTDQTALDAVLTFMREVGQATSANVLLTPENMPAVPMIRYDSTTNTFSHIPPADWPS